MGDLSAYSYQPIDLVDDKMQSNRCQEQKDKAIASESRTQNQLTDQITAVLYTFPT